MPRSLSSWSLLALLAACSGKGSVGAPDASPSASADAGEAGPVSPGSGSATVMGSADGAPFDTAVMSLLLGAPDSPASTVVYVFSKPVMCSDLATPGWDKRITNGTQFLELKMEGTSPATFTVVTTPTPAPGEASVNYTLSSTTGTPVETSGTRGTVTLVTLQANAAAGGTFALEFGTNTLSGTFDAVICPGGHEP